MPACKDLTGQTFNLLTVLRKTEKRQNNFVVWECQCECGNICEVTSTKITKNRTKSCGCLNHKPVFKDLSNQRFGKLIAIEPTYKKNNHRSMIWKCKCDCGNIYEVAAENLLKGTKSCGCYTSEWQKEWGKTRRYDLTNKKFGKLTALYIQEDNDKQRVWHCICECGNECNIEARYLLNGHTKSCGCAKIGCQTEDLTGRKFNRLTVLSLDEEKNNTTITRKGVEGVITTDESKIPAYVVATDEELMIARDTYQLSE